MKIVVDGNETHCGLAALLSEKWAEVEVRRLDAGDVAVGNRILVERKTVDDVLASLADGRLFRQAVGLGESADRPVFILEGNPFDLCERLDPGALRGVALAITVGFRIPVLVTKDIPDTASCIRHMAAQEARRQARRRRAARRKAGCREGPHPRRLPREAFRLILDLPGVGHERALAIAERIGSLRDVSRCSVRDLMAVPGVGPDTAARIVDALRGESLSSGMPRSTRGSRDAASFRHDSSEYRRGEPFPKS